MDQIYEGNVCWVFPDNFDTDQICGVKNMAIYDFLKLAPIAMDQFTENFAATVQKGDILITGRNFGYGHPHGQGMGVMRHLGIQVVLAESFSHNFYRSELAENGMVLLTVPKISRKVKRGDKLYVDYRKGIVKNLTTGEAMQGIKPSPIEVELVECKSLKAFMVKKVKELKENPEAF